MVNTHTHIETDWLWKLATCSLYCWNFPCISKSTLLLSCQATKTITYRIQEMLHHWNYVQIPTYVNITTLWLNLPFWVKGVDWSKSSYASSFRRWGSSNISIICSSWTISNMWWVPCRFMSIRPTRRSLEVLKEVKMIIVLLQKSKASKKCDLTEIHSNAYFGLHGKSGRGLRPQISPINSLKERMILERRIAIWSSTWSLARVNVLCIISRMSLRCSSNAKFIKTITLSIFKDFKNTSNRLNKKIRRW